MTPGPKGRAFAFSDFPADQAVERPGAAAAHHEVQHHDRPEQRVFDAAVLPGKAELPVIGDDGDDQEADDGPGDEAGEKAEREAGAADEFDRADDGGPEQAVLEADAFKKFCRRRLVAEQNRITMDGERAAGHEPDERLGDGCKGAVDAAENRDESRWSAMT